MRDVWQSALDAQDPAGLAAIYAEDGALLPPNSETMSGRAAIEAYWTEFQASGIGIEIKDTEVYAQGDVGYKVGTFTATDPGGATIDEGKYVEIWRHVDGKWQLHRDIWNSDLPTTPAPQPDYAAELMMISAAAASAEYVPVAGFPQGADLSVLYGDPSAGAFEMYFRLQPGVGVPMHFHTSAERAVGIQGTMTMEYQDGSKADISPGNYMFIPSKMPHAATCPAAGPACIAYFYFDQAFDVTWLADPPENPNPMPTGS